MKSCRLIAAILSAALLTVPATTAFADMYTTSISDPEISELETTRPAVLLRTDYKEGFTTLFFTIPQKDFDILNGSGEKGYLKMQLWFGDMSEERDEDVELPMAAYHVEVFVDSIEHEDRTVVSSFAEDSEIIIDYPAEEFTTANGTHVIALSYSGDSGIANEAETTDEFRFMYYITDGKDFLDGSRDWVYLTSIRKVQTDISSLKNGKISSKRYTGKPIKPALTVKDGSVKLTEGTDFTVTYKNNKACGTASAVITGKGKYTGTRTVTFKIVPGKTTLSGTSAKRADGWKKATLSWKKSAGADGYQIYYSENGGKFTKLATTNSEKLSRNLRFSNGSIVEFKVRPYAKSNGKTVYGAWSNTVTLK